MSASFELDHLGYKEISDFEDINGNIWFNSEENSVVVYDLSHYEMAGGDGYVWTIRKYEHNPFELDNINQDVCEEYKFKKYFDLINHLNN